MNNQDKGKVTTHDQSDLNGLKPFSSIGSGRVGKIIKKLKKKKADSLRAKGSTYKEGIKANTGKITDAIGNFTINK
jgi:hypothetical protein